MYFNIQCFFNELYNKYVYINNPKKHESILCVSLYKEILLHHLCG